MGTTLTMELDSAGGDPLRISEECFDEITRMESRISTWKSTSELSKLNRQTPGVWIEMSPELSRDLNPVISSMREYRDFFSPFLAPLVLAWGLRSGGRLPQDSEVSAALRSSREGVIEFRWQKDSGGGVVGAVKRNDSDAGIEEGGFGKGLALDRLSGILTKNHVPSARFDFGGQILVRGGSREWIDVASPTARQERILRFPLLEGSVSTSGNGERGMVVPLRGKKIRIGHLLDPFTGKPAPFEGSVTALAPTGLEAEMLSKVFVLGPDRGMKWAKEHEKAVLWVLPGASDGSWIARASCRFPRELEAVSNRVRIIRQDQCGSQDQNNQ